MRGVHSHLLCLAHKTLRIHRMPSLNRVLFTVTVKFTEIKLLKKLFNQKTTFIQHAVQLTVASLISFILQNFLERVEE